MLYAEALLYLDGASQQGESVLLMAQAMDNERRMDREVLNALSRTWPLQQAALRFQARCRWG